MAYNLVTQPILQFFHDGVPLAGGQVFFYISGTTTKITLYQNNSGTTTPNPVILDADGITSNSGTQIPIFFTAGTAVKMVVTVAGAGDPPSSTLWTVDPYTGQSGTDLSAYFTATDANTLTFSSGKTLVIPSGATESIAGTLTATGTADFTSGTPKFVNIYDTNGNKMVVFAATASAGTWLTVANATAGTGTVTLGTANSSGAGTSSVPLKLKPQGAPTTASVILDTCALNLANAVTVASATTTDIGNTFSNSVTISGTTTITAFGATPNAIRFLTFSGILILTHNATTLILPNNGNNITTAAGDTCIAVSDSSGSNWRVFDYQRVNGRALVSTSPLLQHVSSSSAAVATGTTTIPLDDTIPQNSEGDQYFSVSITPAAATSRLVFQGRFNVTNSNANLWTTVAMFSSTNPTAANAIVANSANTMATATLGAELTLYHEFVISTQMPAYSSGAITFTFRIGANGAGTTTLNGTSGARLYGGVGFSWVAVTEYSS